MRKSHISPLLGLAEYVKRLAPHIHQRIADVWLSYGLKSSGLHAAALNLATGDGWYNWHNYLLIDRLVCRWQR
ncbi:hypothetical protein FPR31_01250 [Salmonella enterica]|nr:hypothetical protein [Salmonella enterica]ECI2571965.1 hypothetical protein [Salmonella enterica subsp. enterica serovar Muenchen]ECG7521188.1 hypothetical protein [Salmonella enterica]ECH4227412.1 hypothetical protein [Salmonella enterica]ECH4237895.1 hypothetical protein [Salmonella enterica]